MRAIALLLILANLGFLGWSQLVDVRMGLSDYRERVGAATTPRLVLSTEARLPATTPGAKPSSLPAETDHAVAGGLPGDSAELAVAGITGVAAAGDSQCVSVGAFRDLAEAVQASAVLQTAGFFSRQRVEQGDVWLGYWVSVQNLTSREAAEQALADLAQRGISDAYILPGSEPAKTLSLGVFNDAARAQRRVEEIRSLGLDAQLADRRRPGSVYWLDVDLPGSGALFDPAILQTQPGKIVRLEFRSCAEAAVTPSEGVSPSSEVPG